MATEKTVTIQKTSKRIKFAQVLVKLALLGCLILAGIGYYGQSTGCLVAAVVLAPLLVLVAIFVRWWKWWQHD